MVVKASKYPAQPTVETISDLETRLEVAEKTLQALIEHLHLVHPTITLEDGDVGVRFY